jgi:hypothetical protein
MGNSPVGWASVGNMAAPWASLELLAPTARPAAERLDQMMAPTLRKTLWMANHLRCRYFPDGQLTLPSQKKNLTAGRLRQHHLIQDHLSRTTQRRLETQMTTVPTLSISFCPVRGTGVKALGSNRGDR